MVRMLTGYHLVPPSVLVINHFLILSRKTIGSALGSSCLKQEQVKQVFVILIISDTGLHHDTPF